MLNSFRVYVHLWSWTVLLTWHWRLLQVHEAVECTESLGWGNSTSTAVYHTFVKIICSTCTWTIFEPHLEKAILCVCVSYDGTWHYLRRLTDEAQYLEIVQQGHWMWAYNINIATYASSSWTPRFHQQHHLPHSQTKQTMTFGKMIITLFL